MNRWIQFIGAACVVASLTGCETKPDNFSFDTITDHSVVPIDAHVFWQRADLVTYCVDHNLTFDTYRDACARPYRHKCVVAVPSNGRYDHREVYAECDNWVPRFKDLF